jgi:hypothetical protein
MCMGLLVGWASLLLTSHFFPFCVSFSPCPCNCILVSPPIRPTPTGHGCRRSSCLCACARACYPAACASCLAYAYAACVPHLMLRPCIFTCSRPCHHISQPGPHVLACFHIPLRTLARDSLRCCLALPYSCG